MATIANGRPGHEPSFFDGLSSQMRVIGALILREMHTRYGRENIGYLWLIGEPFMLASVITALHVSGHTPYGSDIKPLAFAVLGYTTYIMFRGIVNRSEGALESNAPLLYHRMVTILDITTARALLEAAGTVSTYLLLMALLVSLGLADPPARPLYWLLGTGAMLWCSWGQSLIITSISFDNRLVGRIVHPYTYFMIPLSGAWVQLQWVPDPYRTILSWWILPHIFELVRYGQFHSANLDYFSARFLLMFLGIQTWIGLVCVRIFRRKMHLQ